MGPRHGAEAGALLAAAGAALRRAKAEGRRSYRFYTAAAAGQAVRRLGLQSELMRAVERREMRFHYQPKIDVATGELAGVEALLRWRHPHRGLLLPAEFIEVADAMGLTAAMTGEGLRCALAQLAKWDAGGIDVPSVAVNLSARQFGDTRLAEEVAAELERHGIAPARLQLEITETAMLQFEGRTAANIERLAALGVTLSLDDFGTGYSNLAYLKRLPIGQLKIDRSFVADLGGARDTLPLVRAIVAMGAGLGMRVVAEGVETRAQLDALRMLGCHEVQGFLFAAALTAGGLARFAAARAGARAGQGTGPGPVPTNACRCESNPNGTPSPGRIVTLTQPTNGLP
jgi:EAL domain-containing protein (putative c-di-GMP-specific phosphodiesterase class I)